MKQIRKISSVLLLLCIFVLLSPRSWTHRCDDIPVQKKQSGAVFKSHDCLACLQDIHVFDIPQVVIFKFNRKPYTDLSEILPVEVQLPALRSFQLRGPPLHG